MSWQDFRRDLYFNKIENSSHHRNFEIDFVLKYIPDISFYDNSSERISILDVGCCESDLIYEIHKRGYASYGIDIRDYEKLLPKEITFIKEDITDINLCNKYKDKFYTIIALSTIEHVGLSVYTSKEIINGDRFALQNIHNMLHGAGYFIITIPSKPWQSDSGRGYSPHEFFRLIQGLFIPYELTQGGGQICAALIKHS